jgi:hypothetical protein
MSDLLSPLLFTLRDEPLSFLCFQSLMKRCLANFDPLSEQIAAKIALLTAMLARYDPPLWLHLGQLAAHELCFTYRWLLIECKREFPFNDSLRVLEVMWSTIDAADATAHAKSKCHSNSSSKTSPGEYADDYILSDEEMRERANSYKLSTPDFSSKKMAVLGRDG